MHTVSQVAKQLGFSSQTIRVWIKSGAITATLAPGTGRKKASYRISDEELKRLKGHTNANALRTQSDGTANASGTV